MSRIACLLIPRFQIVAQQKHEQLKHQPLALVTGKLTAGGYSRAHIFMCSAEADKYGIVPDMRLSEAKAQCAQLILRERDEVLYKMMQNKLVTDLISCSPKVKAQEMGVILLDASGLTLTGGENNFCHHVLKTCGKSGFTNTYIGIADSAFAAIVASHSTKRRINIVPATKDAQFLAPLSIKHLRLAPEVEDTLLTLGITTMGKLSQIPIASLNERFNKAGEIIWKPWELSQGIDNRQPTLPQPEKVFQCFLDLGGVVSSFNDIVFALKSMLDRLTADLKQDGLQAQEIILSLYHDNNKFDERILQLIRPSHEAKFLLEVIRLSLAAKPLECELTGISLGVSRFTPEQWSQVNLAALPTQKQIIKQINTQTNNQLSLAKILADHQQILEETIQKRQIADQARHTPVDTVSLNSSHTINSKVAHNNLTNNKITNDNNKLTSAQLLLLQRFAIRLGKNKIFTAMASDQYISEDAGVWMPVVDNVGARVNAPVRSDDLQVVAARLAEPSVLPLDMAYIKTKSCQAIPPDLVLKQTQPPYQVLVQIKDSKPTAINYKKRWYKIKSITQPEYLSPQWWDKSIAKYYYKVLVELANAAAWTATSNQQLLLMLLVYDKLKNNWCVEGLYD